MNKILILLLFIPLLSLGQEYEIKANATVGFTRICLDKAFNAVSVGDSVGFESLQKQGCIGVPGDTGNGLSGIRIILVDRGMTISKFYLKGYPSNFVWLLNDQAILVR